MTDNQQKARVLVVGTGGFGGKAEVTAVLRSIYDAVEKDGFEIDSVQYGRISGWRPAQYTIPSVTSESLPPFDFILVTTKNTLDIPPSVAEIIAPAVTPGHTVIILAQNGLNPEGPHAPGKILHDDPDIQRTGAFANPNLEACIGEDAAKRWIAVYNPDDRLETIYDPDDLPDLVIRGDPVDTGCKPSMAQDAEKGGFMEIENIVAEPLRGGRRGGWICRR
ncbi:hypothetical protein BDW75DRAFT_230657 [Aspergillus navahoensis]